MRMGRPVVQVVDGKKPCSGCKEILPIEKFVRDSSAASGYATSCRDCQKGRRTGVIPPIRDPGSERRTPKDSVLWTKYGIRMEDYDRMYEDQEGRCLICQVQSDVLCVDHDHFTRKVRALICRECNFGLGKFADDPGRLMAAAAYLLSFKEG